MKMAEPELLDVYPAAYQRSYRVFNHDPHTHSYFKPWVNGEFVNALKKYSVKQGDNIKVLSLGCGEGNLHCNVWIVYSAMIFIAIPCSLKPMIVFTAK